MKNFLSKILLTVLIFSISACNTKEIDKLVSLKNSKITILEKKDKEIFQYWEFENKSFLWENDLGQIRDLEFFQDSLKKILGTTKFKEVLKKEQRNKSFNIIPFESENGDSINAELVHSGKIGKIRKMNFLEAQLLNYQISRYPLLNHPTEFHGFIMSNKALKRIRVYFAASDQPWPPKPHLIIDAIEKDLKKGWKLKFHLHNHYEPKSNNYLGILAPSMTDAHYYNMLKEEYKIEKAIITNGFNTVEIKANDFNRLKAN